MPKQLTKSLPVLSSEKDFRRKLRDGQAELLRRCKTTQQKQLNVKWPGGYGKSLGIALAFRAMLDRNQCDRLLIVVANDTQRRQILNDFQQDAADVALHLPPTWKISSEISTFRASEKGAAVVFVATIQQVSASAKALVNYVLELMRHGGFRWMVAADEYHHYAEQADWGDSLKPIVAESVFCLATSATPYRDGNATIFGKPDLEVTYSQGVAEGALKPIARRCYEYRIDYIDRDGNPCQFTSEELRLELNAVKNIDVFQAKKNLRMSNKYVIPIVSEPLYRLRARRNQTGKPLQMLVRAMSCEHAQRTCEQIRSLCEDLEVDWVGTGPDGRSDDENQKIISEFCPRKDSKGNRPNPKIDVLVQVGMADEGFDSIMVVEIVDLHIVTLDGASTKSKQFYKRGTRAVGDEVLYINVGTDHPLSALEGNQVQNWLDSDMTIPEAKDTPKDPEDFNFDEWWLPEFLPKSQEKFVDAELTDMQVDKDPRFPKFKQDFSEKAFPYQPSDDELRQWFRRGLSSDEDQSRSITLEQQRQYISRVVGQIAHAVMKRTGVEFERSRLGDYSKRINQMIIRQFGKRREEMLPDELESLYEWIKEIHHSVKVDQVPSWLR